MINFLIIPGKSKFCSNYVEDPHTFIDLFVSNDESTLLMRSCAFYPKFGVGALGIFLVLLKIGEVRTTGSSGDLGSEFFRLKFTGGEMLSDTELIGKSKSELEDEYEEDELDPPKFFHLNDDHL
ncbi:uncharacterized protein LOC114078070 [Solanum pennellii]|uniref:Uncharacterized protein LOC114078070 n=1 Tax=Solanum pennellii TaxID=28526 RepID=A0ABM1VFI9_SOLPN|nr:uncharacterized protein LOC114078070 [Solanum pennellii]